MVQFPGISASYETPANPDLILPTHEIDVEESVNRIIAHLKQRGFIP
jgi:adenylylsulfate kinase-like enzyme